ncbi:formimidoylglutamase [Dethiothermospora halolimnae]|uniref:formimidoylglutamase n=1 Tax=Dethiothermospora halolimnae TaxID=3114390 RepID=UPI003CCB9869
MFTKNYRPIDETIWQGRIDSESNFEAFRWHQWVKKIDLTKEGLEVDTGKLGFAIMGFCCDKGVKFNKGRTGAIEAPTNIRKKLANLPCSFTKDVKLYDAGDIICEDCTLEESQELLSKAVDKVLSLNLFPIVLGGGHEIAFGHYNGILNYLSKENNRPNIGIINFDAHFDLRPYPKGGNSGTMFRQIADICKERELNYSYFCFGVQPHSNTVDLFNTANKLDVQYILAEDVVGSNDFTILEKLDYFIKKQEHLYVTICSDVFSSVFAPGVSAIEPLGLEPDKVLKFLKYILRSGKVISFDIAEVSPRFDQDHTTSKLASIIIFNTINAITKNHNLYV